MKTTCPRERAVSSAWIPEQEVMWGSTDLQPLWEKKKKKKILGCKHLRFGGSCLLHSTADEYSIYLQYYIITVTPIEDFLVCEAFYLHILSPIIAKINWNTGIISSILDTRKLKLQEVRQLVKSHNARSSGPTVCFQSSSFMSEPSGPLPSPPPLSHLSPTLSATISLKCNLLAETDICNI